MNIKPTLSTLVPYIIVALLTIGFFISIDDTSKRDEIRDLKAQLEFKESQITLLNNKLNQLVAENKVAITSNEETIKKLSEEIFNLKNKDEKKIKEVNTLVRLHQKIEADSLDVPYVGPIILKDTILPEFKDSTKDYTIEGKVLQKGVRINRLIIYDTVSFRIAEKKVGLFKKETVIQSIHTSKYFKTTGMQSITLKKKPTSWNRWVKPVLFSAITGYIVYRVKK